MNSSLQIYFCGSLRGCTPLSDTYKKIVDHLERHGTVLNRVIAYPDGSEKHFDDRQIYERDLSLFSQSNVMVAETTSPSHGVGIELGWAIARKDYPILSLSKAQKEFQTSALIAGSDRIVCKEYADEQDIRVIVDQFMASQK